MERALHKHRWVSERRVASNHRHTALNISVENTTFCAIEAFGVNSDDDSVWELGLRAEQEFCATEAFAANSEEHDLTQGTRGRESTSKSELYLHVEQAWNSEIARRLTRERVSTVDPGKGCRRKIQSPPVRGKTSTQWRQ